MIQFTSFLIKHAILSILLSCLLLCILCIRPILLILTNISSLGVFPDQTTPAKIHQLHLTEPLWLTRRTPGQSPRCEMQPSWRTQKQQWSTEPSDTYTHNSYWGVEDVLGTFWGAVDSFIVFNVFQSTQTGNNLAWQKALCSAGKKLLITQKWVRVYFVSMPILMHHQIYHYPLAED